MMTVMMVINEMVLTLLHCFSSFCHRCCCQRRLPPAPPSPRASPPAPPCDGFDGYCMLTLRAISASVGSRLLLLLSPQFCYCHRHRQNDGYPNLYHDHSHRSTASATRLAAAAALMARTTVIALALRAHSVLEVQTMPTGTVSNWNFPKPGTQ